MRRIAFFFAGADRAGTLEAVRQGALPDSMLRGANFFAEEGGWEVDLVSSSVLELTVPRAFRALIPVPMLQLVLLPKLLRYDAVIASDALLLGYAISLLGGGRTRWVCIAINSSTLIRRHARHPLRRFLLRACWRSNAAIVCLSHEQKLDLVRFGISPERISLIRFGIDTGYFNGGAGQEGEAIVSIGKDLGRDYATLFRAAERAGLPVEVIASRKNFSPDVRVPQGVTIRYDVPLRELRDAYARARFVVVPSLPEGVPVGTDLSGQTVVLEALAMGRAVVATKRAWLEEYLEEGRDYLGIPAGDAEAMAGALRRLSDDAPLRRRLAAAGQRIVRERYSSRRFAAELSGLLVRLSI